MAWPRAFVERMVGAGKLYPSYSYPCSFNSEIHQFHHLICISVQRWTGIGLCRVGANTPQGICHANEPVLTAESIGHTHRDTYFHWTDHNRLNRASKFADRILKGCPGVGLRCLCDDLARFLHRWRHLFLEHDIEGQQTRYRSHRGRVELDI